MFSDFIMKSFGFSDDQDILEEAFIAKFYLNDLSN